MIYYRDRRAWSRGTRRTPATDPWQSHSSGGENFPSGNNALSGKGVSFWTQNLKDGVNYNYIRFDAQMKGMTPSQITGYLGDILSSYSLMPPALWRGKAWNLNLRPLYTQKILGSQTAAWIDAN